mgnify:CR=1 FL=1
MSDTTLSKEEKQYKRLTGEPVARLVLELGLPTTISMLITNLYNMVDTWFVSQLGTSATGAVGVVFGLMVSFLAVYEGSQARPTPEGVAQATTRTVVKSSLLVLGLDFILTALMFH